MGNSVVSHDQGDDPVSAMLSVGPGAGGTNVLLIKIEMLPTEASLVS
jgi:hypothetical protein